MNDRQHVSHHGVDLRGVDLRGVNLRGSTLNGELHIIPEGLLVNGKLIKVEPLRADPAESLLFRRMANFIDLLLEPESAESAIGDLRERYRQRAETDAAHAKRWLIVQVGWLAFERAMQLLGRFSAARAGK
jgi:hypothetical protein